MAGYLSLGELGLDLHPVPFLPATSNLREQHHLGSGRVAPILFGWSRKLPELKTCSSLVVAFFAGAGTAPFLARCHPHSASTPVRLAP